MTLVPFTQCCSILSVDAKTLRQWLKHADLSLHAHPTDARFKCLTSEQVQQIAILHHRCLKEDAAPVPQQRGVAAPLVRGSQKPTQIQLESLATPLPSASPLPPACLCDVDLVKALVCLQATVATLQQQVAGLALELLQERTRPDTPSQQAPEVPVHSSEGHHVIPQARKPLGKPSQQKNAISKEQDRSPSQRRARSCLLPLIEYGAGGTYVVICPEKGELFLTPDSPEWFDWLATLSSFRFMGQQGRLSASRNKGRSCWMAYRRIHGHRYEYALGATSRLTLDHLECMAATLQSHVPAL
jgi:hypothetical protein